MINQKVSGTTLWAIIAANLALHFILFFLGKRSLAGFRWEHDPLHAGVEMAGSVIALLVAMMLMSMHRRGEGPNYAIRISAALIGMGILDGMHAVVHVGNLFVWLHSSATFVGGLLFALVWLPSRWNFTRRWPLIVMAGTLAFGIFNLLIPSWLPAMTTDGQFTPAARSLNLIGGILLLASAAKMVQAWYRYRNNDDLLFCLLGIQLGVAAIMFEYSALWDFPWWGWHLLRLAAYMIALTYIVVCDQATAKLEAAESRSSQLIETAPDGMVIVNERGKILIFNAQAESLFGYSRDELIGQSIEILLPQRLRNDHVAHRTEFIQHPKPRQMGEGDELWAKRKDGTEFLVEVSLSPLETESGMVVSSVVRDVTDRRQQEIALRKARVQADAANQAKSDFLANMSHEIRTPMNGIMGMTELALGTELNREQREFLTTIESSAESLLSLINDILDFSKIEAKKLELDPIDFELRERIGETLSTLAGRAHDKGLELAFEVAGDVPEPLHGDIHRIRQIVVNLLGNAIKFTEKGEVLLRIETEPPKDTEAPEVPNDLPVHLRFTITDTGIGMTQQVMENIFRPFEQADASTTRKYGGTGLGLTICKQLVQLMGGEMSVDSRPGIGTNFSFTLRLGRGTRPTGDASHHEGTASLSSLRGMQVLVVDDNQTNCRILSKMIENWGMKPAVVLSAGEGLQLLNDAHPESRFGLIISDVNMPEMDGFMFAEKVVDSPASKDIPIILLTSANRAGDGARCRELGIAAHLIKPARQSLLYEAIATAVGAADDLPESIRTRTKLPADQADTFLRDLRVLLVEDNETNQKFATRALKKFGHDVTVAANGQEAVDAWRTNTYDVVLMDIQMPIMDGYVATGQIRMLESKTDRHTPIIAMTANAMKGDEERCLAAGMDGYVTKPIKSKVMHAEVARVVRSLPRVDHRRDWTI